MEKLEVEKWTREKYQEYLSYLKSLGDETYKNFHKRLTPTKYEILGIPVPIQRKIANSISKGDISSFLKVSASFYYEEVMIKGFVLAKIKEKEKFLSYLDAYVSLIDNWAICDGFCNSLKIVKQDKVYWFSYFSLYLKSKETFRIRVGLIVFLSFYVEEEYIEKIFKLLDTITVDTYYVNMGVSWLLCECFIKYKEKTIPYLLESKINAFTFHKTISKIKDSYRVSLEDKKYVSTLKKKEEER